MTTILDTILDFWRSSWGGVYKYFSGAGKVCINKGVFKYLPGFSGAGEVYLNTSPAPEKYFYIYTYLIPLRRRRSLGSILKTFSAPDKYLYTLFRRRKCLYTLIWRRRGRRSIYIHRHRSFARNPRWCL